MISLLNSNFIRLKKNKVFVSCLISIIVLCFFLLGLQCLYKYRDNEKIFLESVIFIGPLFVSVLTAIFTSLFIGTDYSDGTIRNKLIIGHKRKNIYIANLITSIITSLLELIIYIVLASILGIILLDGFQFNVSKLIIMLIDSTFVIVALCSIFTCISSLCTNSTMASVGSILTIFGMILITFIFVTKLTAPEYLNSYAISSDGYEETTYKNPDYVTGTKRKVYQFIVDVIPSGQAWELQITSHDWNYNYLSFYSISVTILFTIIGIRKFKYLDLN